jgi:CRISPR system Cascade subunit CasB
MTAPVEIRTRPEDRFAEHLAALAEREDRAALAELRRGLGKEPGEVAGAYRLVAAWLSPTAGRHEEQAYYLAATLFGLHPQSWRPGDVDEDNAGERHRGDRNLGASLAWLARERGREGVERRFVALLDCDRGALPAHLRHAVALLRTEDVPVDWAQLIRDIRVWDAPHRRVQRRWARAFWGGQALEPAEPAAATAPTEDDD